MEGCEYEKERTEMLKKFFSPNHQIYYDDPNDDLQYDNFKIHEFKDGFIICELDNIYEHNIHEHNFIYLDIKLNKTTTNYIKKQKPSTERTMTCRASQFVLHTFLLKKLRENNIPLYETKYNYRYKMKYCPWARMCELYDLDPKHAMLKIGHAKTFTYFWKYFREKYVFLKPLLEKESWARQLLLSFVTRFGKIDKLNTKKYKWIIENTEYFYLYNLRKERHINDEKLLEKCRELFPKAKNNIGRAMTTYHDKNGRVRIKFNRKIFRGLKVKTIDILNLHTGKPCQIEFKFPPTLLGELCLAFNNPSTNITLTNPTSLIGGDPYKIDGTTLRYIKSNIIRGIDVDMNINIKCSFKLLKNLIKHIDYLSPSKTSHDIFKTFVFPWIEEYLKTIDNNRKLVWRKKAANKFKIKYYEQSFSKL